MVDMIVPFSPIVEGIGGCLVLIEIIADLVWGVSESSCELDKCKKCGENPEIRHQSKEGLSCSDRRKPRLQVTKASWQEPNERGLLSIEEASDPR